MDLAAPNEPQGGSEQDTVSIIAGVLVEKFGDRALDVAARQLDAASSNSRDRWDAVVSHLTL